MDPLIGIWRLVEGKAWDEAGNSLPPPYGRHPLGQIVFTAERRMLAALCNGDTDAGSETDRGYSSYGGVYTLRGTTLTTDVDIASDTRRIGGQQVREAFLDGDRLLLRPPLRAYNGTKQQRELLWERIWRPSDDGDQGSIDRQK
jgi:Lipocalin-like domain